MNNVRRALRALAMAGLGALAVVGVVALVSLFARHPLYSALGAGAVVVACSSLVAVVARVAPRVPATTVLELDLPVAPPEVAGGSPVAALTGRRATTLAGTVTALGRAARDKRVRGLVLRPRFALAPQALIEELRDAIIAFGNAGKFTVAVADTFGEGGPSNSAYCLATACAEVVVHPTGLVGLAPLSSERNFYRGLLDRLGVEVEVFARQEYKSAGDQLSQIEATGPDREQRQRLLDSLWEHQVDYVARARNLAPGEVRRLADQAPLLASEALGSRLVDRLAYTDEVLSAAKDKAGPKAKLLYLASYNKRAGKERRRGKSAPVTVLRVAGEIHRASTVPFGFAGGPVAAADRLVPLVRAAAKDKKTKAFVLRIDSPGGSAIASDTIWRELVKLREAGKPLVVSMGAVAASGGYYLAAAADRVVAQPGTITGSIGIIAMHPVIAKAKEKLDVRAAGLHTGAEPAMWSVNRPLSSAQRRRTEAQLDDIYQGFTRRVAEGRKLPIEKVLEIARGRVWTGADALDIGLVDELGGLERAMALAVELSGAAPGTRPRPRPLPRRPGPWRRLRRAEPENSEDVTATSADIAGGLLAGTSSAARAFQRQIWLHVGCDPKQFWVP